MPTFINRKFDRNSSWASESTNVVVKWSLSHARLRSHTSFFFLHSFIQSFHSFLLAAFTRLEVNPMTSFCRHTARWTTSYYTNVAVIRGVSFKWSNIRDRWGISLPYIIGCIKILTLREGVNYHIIRSTCGTVKKRFDTWGLNEESQERWGGGGNGGNGKIKKVLTFWVNDRGQLRFTKGYYEKMTWIKKICFPVNLFC